MLVWRESEEKIHEKVKKMTASAQSFKFHSNPFWSIVKVLLWLFNYDCDFFFSQNKKKLFYFLGHSFCRATVVH